MNPLMGILRRSFRKDVNILCGVTHERYQNNFKDLPFNFYMMNDKTFVKWKEDHAPIPKNHQLHDVMPSIPFDIVLSQNKFTQFQILTPFAQKYNLPVISLEHTLPPENKEWLCKNFNNYNKMRGHVNVFISDYSRKAWGFNDSNSVVVKHCVDNSIFNNLNIKRDNIVLTVANDYINRDHFLNFKQYVKITQNMPTRAVGNTPGFSKAASSINELVNIYNSSSIFLNTAHLSPIPMSLLEAMACGCCVISCKTCAIPEYVNHGVTGLLYENDEEAKKLLYYYLNNPKEAREIGNNASDFAKKELTLSKFTENWFNIFKSVL